MLNTQKLLQLFNINDFEIWAPQCPTHYIPAGNVDVMDTVVHKNIRFSNVIVSDIPDSDHLPKYSTSWIILELQNSWKDSKIVIDWGWLQSIATDIVSPRIEINLGIESDKAVCNFTASVALVYQLSTTKLILLELNNDLPDLDHLLSTKRD
jgi:hypothetical protein